VGCGTSSQPAGTSATQVAAGHNHEGWWCAEHGVPEEVCAQCSAKIAADFKAKGDWCKEHDRPESQCFVCHPEKQAEFAALYEAKYGKQPPAIDAPH
jgi:cobalt-zinc-cadmium efflux system membrane fusion protein